jgi:hypothetical protein
MSFTDVQVRKLQAPLRPRHVKEREIEGKRLSYVEGWHVVAEANRIFGFDAWDRETISSSCVWQKQVDHRHAAAYMTSVRITVRAGDRVIVREGLGSGEAIAPTVGQAHERASKAAETDATKRALTTFGNPFGLSLYSGKTKSPKPPREHRETPEQTPATAGDAGAMDVANDASHVAFEPSAIACAQGPSCAVPDAALTTAVETPPATCPDTMEPPPIEPAQRMASLSVYLPPLGDRPRIDKSELALPEPKRLRDRHHLRFVASHPCLVCGRAPCQAHHLRIAQPRALGRKVSDEFTVPLCPTHHHELHMRGDEGQWWRDRKVDPAPIANELWRESRSRPEIDAGRGALYR